MTKSTVTLLSAAGLMAAFCLGAENAGAGDFYKWVDANGQVHFSDTPVAAEATKINVLEQGDVQIEKTTPGARRDNLNRLRRRKAAARDQGFKLNNAEYKKKIAATADAAAKRKSPEPTWRARAVESCKKGGLRKNCDSEEEIQKRRPISAEASARRQKQRIKESQSGL